MNKSSMNELLTSFHAFQVTKNFFFYGFQEESKGAAFKIAPRAPRRLIEKIIFEVFKAKGSKIEQPILKYINVKNEIVPFDKLLPESKYQVFITESSEVRTEEMDLFQFMKVEDIMCNDYATVLSLEEHERSIRLAKEFILAENIYKLETMLEEEKEIVSAKDGELNLLRVEYVNKLEKQNEVYLEELKKLVPMKDELKSECESMDNASKIVSDIMKAYHLALKNEMSLEDVLGDSLIYI